MDKRPVEIVEITEFIYSSFRRSKLGRVNGEIKNQHVIGTQRKVLFLKVCLLGALWFYIPFGGHYDT